MNVTETELTDLKKEIDRVTDYYDTVRIYQFPLNGMFVITELKQKRWKRCQMRSDSEPAKKSAAPLPRRPAHTAAPRGTMHKQ